MEYCKPTFNSSLRMNLDNSSQKYFLSTAILLLHYRGLCFSVFGIHPFKTIFYSSTFKLVGGQTLVSMINQITNHKYKNLPCHQCMIWGGLKPTAFRDFLVISQHIWLQVQRVLRQTTYKMNIVVFTFMMKHFLRKLWWYRRSLIQNPMLPKQMLKFIKVWSKFTETCISLGTTAT